MAKVKYLSRAAAEDYLRNYCELVNITYKDDFLTMDKYGVNTSESFPGLNTMDSIRDRLDLGQKVDRETLKSSLWVISKYICLIQLYDIVEKHCSFCFSFNKTVYCLDYLHDTGKLSTAHYDMLLPIFSEEYEHRVLEILSKHSINKLPLSDKLSGITCNDKVFGCYSPQFIQNSDVLIKSSILNLDRNFINSELLVNMFMDTLSSILNRFYIGSDSCSIYNKVAQAFDYDLLCCLKTSRRALVVRRRLLDSKYLLNRDSCIDKTLSILRGEMGV